MSDHWQDRCTYCSEYGHTVQYCPRKPRDMANKGTAMNRILIGAALILAATALVAQDAEMTPEQQAEKCASEGGCVYITRDALINMIQSAADEGAASCAGSL